MWLRPELLTRGPSTFMMQEEERPRQKLAALAAANLAESQQGEQADQSLLIQKMYLSMTAYIYKPALTNYY